LTTARNASGYIAETIESIRAQTFGAWCYIVVDDASDDSTPDIVERYVADDRRVRLVQRDETGGPYAAANTGLALITTKYVARIDADDLALPHRFERQVAFLEARQNLRACAAQIDVLREGRLQPLRLEPFPTLPGAVKWALCPRWLMPSTALIETEALREVGGYVELPASQDHRLWCELSRRGWLGSIDEVLVHWRTHEGQISTARSDLQHELGIDIVAEHLRELTGEVWTREEISVLRRLGQPEAAFIDGLRVIRRFDRAWRADRGLDPAERTELADLVAGLRRRHVRGTLGGLARSNVVSRALLRQMGRA
jgi:glycosyltransferase involved in cell wall biosynthesis